MTGSLADREAEVEEERSEGSGGGLPVVVADDVAHSLGGIGQEAEAEG